MRWWVVVDDVTGEDVMDYVLNTTKCEDRSEELGGSHTDHLKYGSNVRTDAGFVRYKGEHFCPICESSHSIIPNDHLRTQQHLERDKELCERSDVQSSRGRPTL